MFWGVFVKNLVYDNDKTLLILAFLKNTSGAKLQ